MLGKRAVRDLFRGLHDGVAQALFQFAQRHVGQRRRFLLHAEGANQRIGHALAADAEILQRTLGLRPPQPVGWHLHGAHRVAFIPMGIAVGGFGHDTLIILAKRLQGHMGCQKTECTLR